MMIDSMMFSIIPIIMPIIFIIIIGMFIVTAIRAIGQWGKNNASPVLSVSANVVSKRSNTRVHHHAAGDGMNHRTSSTTYYITFEVESGDRIELSMSGSEYGLIAEGDAGLLTFQGTRYKGFARKKKVN